MLVSDVINSGALPSLELTMRFAARRQEILAHNIANLTTPGFVQQDVPPRQFQDQLAAAIDRRRGEGSGSGELAWPDSDEIRRDPSGDFRLTPRSPSGSILNHDRNNRDLERLMQDLAENTGAFRAAAELFRSNVEMLRGAIAERV